jgi:hypothetical protein
MEGGDHKKQEGGGMDERKSASPGATPDLFTVGHSTHELDFFLQLLRQAGITALADVRSRPYSRRLPQYNRPELEQALAANEIAYVFLGELLGGRPADADVYDDEGRVNYEKVRRTFYFHEGLDRLRTGMERDTIALFCAEEDPLECHRGLMIAPALVETGVLPVHLRGNGARETTADLEERLLLETRVGSGFLDGLFAEIITQDERRELLAKAYRLQAHRKAFRLKDGPPKNFD